MRDSAVFYRSYHDAIKTLQPENQAEVWNAIFEFSFYGKEIELSGISKTIFTLIKPQLEANSEKWKNGKKGGRKPKEENEETKTEPNGNQTETKTEPKQNQNESKPKPNGNGNGNGNENENENASGFQKKSIPSPIPKNQWDEWKRRKKEFSEKLRENAEKLGLDPPYAAKLAGQMGEVSPKNAYAMKLFGNLEWFFRWVVDDRKTEKARKLVHEIAGRVNDAIMADLAPPRGDDFDG